MQTPQTEDSNETVVIPLFEVVIYPDSRTKFNVDKATGELLLETLKNGGAVRAIGLTVKSGIRPSEVTTESLYRTGNLFRIPRVDPRGTLSASRSSGG
jgi:ATP-dependent Lon protease